MTNESKLPKSPRFSAEVRERAVRMVQEHRSDHASHWAAIVSISTKIGCTAETLRRWVHEAGRIQGRGAPDQSSGQSIDERLRQLERENRELRQANEILRKASAYFAQAELDRRPK